MKFRKGDLVFYYDEEYKHGKDINVERIALIDGTEKDWWVIENHVSIHNVGNISLILDIKDIFSMVKREDLEEWWEFI